PPGTLLRAGTSSQKMISDGHADNLVTIGLKGVEIRAINDLFSVRIGPILSDGGVDVPGVIVGAVAAIVRAMAFRDLSLVVFGVDVGPDGQLAHIAETKSAAGLLLGAAHGG